MSNQFTKQSSFPDLKFTLDTTTPLVIDTEENNDVIDNEGEDVIDVEVDDVDTGNLDSQNDGNTNDRNDSSDSNDSNEDSPYINTLNKLAELDLISEFPEGMTNDTDFDLENTIKVINHNVTKRISDERKTVSEKTLANLFDKLSPITSELISYELNHGSDSEGFVQRLLMKEAVENLDVTKVEHQIKIVEQFYTSNGDSQDEVIERINDLKEAGLLEKEAKRLEPKLKIKASDEVKVFQAKQEDIKRKIQSAQKDLEKKTSDILGTGKVGNVPLDNTTAQFLANTILNNDVPVLFNGKRIEVGAAEALIMKHKFQGNLERLMGAILYLERPELFEKHYQKQAETKEATKFFIDSRRAASTTGKTNIQEKPDKNLFFTMKK